MGEVVEVGSGVNGKLKKEIASFYDSHGERFG